MCENIFVMFPSVYNVFCQMKTVNYLIEYVFSFLGSEISAVLSMVCLPQDCKKLS